jgi:carboxypeptidase PM20D1
MKVRHIALAVLGLLTAVLVARALLMPRRQLSVPPAAMLPLDEAAAARRFARALTFPTITNDGAAVTREPFVAMHDYLKGEFPLAHATLRREVISDLSLLYRWEGSHPEREPLVLLAHQDVVPVEPGADSAWSYPPFGGVMADGFVWGRGALDCKAGLLASLEAAETLMASGFVPARPVYLAFGHDEEIGGRDGAQHIAAVLAAEGRRAYLVLDEGMVIADGIVPGMARPVALIGVAEKGRVTLELTAHGEPGHSAMPPRTTAVGRLGRALAALEDHPFPASMDSALGTLRFLAPEMGFGPRLLFANSWVFGPIMTWGLSRVPSTNALLRTTSAPTMLRGGPKENVLPASASAIVNVRIRPGENREGVIHVIQGIVGPDLEISVRGDSSDPSPESPTEGEGFDLLRRSIVEAFPGVVTAPALVTGGTDARYYTKLTDRIYRFSPLPIAAADLQRVHGTNERLAIGDYAGAVRFYARLISNAAR